MKLPTPCLIALPTLNRTETDITLMLTLGIEFGKPGPANSIEPVKYAGTGKILKVG